ncbi:GNAT family N-acetyltransferase [Streptomyces sp. NPDC055287]
MNPIRAEVITTARLDLLPLRVSHAGEMAAVRSDPRLHTFIGGAPATPHELRERYARLVAGSPRPGVSWCNSVVSLRDEECLVGTVQATVAADGRKSAAEIAWVVGTPWQGCGIAPEAASGLVAWLVRDATVGTVAAHVHPDHHASAAVAAAAGLARTGRRHEGEVAWELRL